MLEIDVKQRVGKCPLIAILRKAGLVGCNIPAVEIGKSLVLVASIEGVDDTPGLNEGVDELALGVDGLVLEAQTRGLDVAKLVEDDLSLILGPANAVLQAADGIQTDLDEGLHLLVEAQ